MAPVDTPAIVLSTLRYGETSKIARLATRELGVVSAIAKGALRPKSRFGASLEALSEGAATIALSRASDLHTLTAFDTLRLRVGLAEQLGRYAVASALGELMLRFAPHDRQPEAFDFLRASLDVLEAIPADVVDSLGLRLVWGLVEHLGFGPSLDRCVRDGREVPAEQSAAFSAAEGGVLCARCSRAVEATVLQPEHRRDLARLLGGEATLPDLDRRHAAAHRRLVDRYVHHHLTEGTRLPALSFWASGTWHAASP